MFKIISIYILFFSMLIPEVYAQKKLPIVYLTDLEGKRLSLNEMSEDHPVILSFWATWCEPCLRELSAMNKDMDLIENELNAKLAAISIDDSRTTSRIIPLLKGNEWSFQVFLDQNQDLKRTFNIIDIPHTIIVYKNKIRYENTGYINGDERVLYEEIRNIEKQ
ncbi:TlpA family protein disulfide reductase [Lutimonas zeaxanthinifaciens]|uniref:TlpA family protein disulfide reductase n=1 Tax=Lutimonas zeaxanthinifaciens TaxID=3060215 RepID=UPI00265D195A|nr:TlpA disulfide reductase family protein [Lutimonas sp. YSD2104]WKK65487.1 TlpA disulfide reductase family protein [Lutimonas sp. YSD2104]